MIVEKGEVVELLGPLLSVAPGFWLDSMAEFNREHTDEMKMKLGPRHRAEYVRDMALYRARSSDAIATNYVPIVDDQLEALVLDGSTPISVLFNKVSRFKGMLRSGTQNGDRRSGQLILDGILTIPLVCFYMLERPMNRLRPAIERIGIGLESPAGFDWIHMLWTAEGGLSSDVVMPQLPLIPAASIKLRKPDEATGDFMVGADTKREWNTQREDTGESSGTMEGA